MADFVNKLRPLIAPLAIILVAGSLSFYWLSNQPRASRKLKPVLPPLVEVIEPARTHHRTSIFAMGSVIASQSVNLNARVSGMVISVSENFIEGGLLKKGEQIVQIDPTDFELAVRQRKSELARAEFDLKLEMGQQSIARRAGKNLLCAGLGAHGLQNRRRQTPEGGSRDRRPHGQTARRSRRSAQSETRQ